MSKRFPVKKYKITDLPEEKQEWLKNLVPPKKDYVNNHFTLKSAKKKRR